MTNIEIIATLQKEYPDTLDGVTPDNLIEKQTQIEMVKRITMMLTPPKKKQGGK